MKKATMHSQNIPVKDPTGEADEIPPINRWRILVYFALFVFASVVVIVFIPRQDNRTADTSIVQIPPSTIPTVSTALSPTPAKSSVPGWMIYTNQEHSFEFMYPDKWELVTNSAFFDKGDVIMVRTTGSTQKESTELYDGGTVTIAEPFAVTSSAEDWLREYFTSYEVEDSAPLEISKKTINHIDYEVIQTCGLGCYTYYVTKFDNNLYRIALFAEGAEKGEYSQINERILTSFHFTKDQKSTTSSPQRVPVESTEGWKKVYNNGITFSIPSDAQCETSETDCTKVSYSTPGMKRMNSTMYIKVESYKNGSRREQFLESNQEVSACNPLYTESFFGDVDALQIAVDGGTCQGGGGGIVSVVGNKLVTIRELVYDPETKEIYRDAVKDTVVSTLPRVAIAQ